MRHKLGFVCANAGIDRSNVGGDDRVLLLPVDPDASAMRLRDGVSSRTGARIGVIISDSLGRPFRLGTVGAAIGVAGLPALWDQCGRTDLHGRRMENTVTALADQIAAAADMVAGQGSEGRGAVVVRGVVWHATETSAAALLRPAERDLYA